MSSFQRRFSSLLNPDNSSSSQSSKSASPSTSNNLSPEMALFNSTSSGNNIRLSATDRHHQRPVSEILKPENFISPESKAKKFILLIPHFNL